RRRCARSGLATRARTVCPDRDRRRGGRRLRGGLERGVGHAAGGGGAARSAGAVDRIRFDPQPTRDPDRPLGVRAVRGRNRLLPARLDRHRHSSDRGGVAHHACVGAAGNYLIPGRFAMPAREFETVLYREEGAVGWITLNRPEQGNMFNAVMLGELRTVLEDTRLETRTRVLVLTGAGDRFFCLGGDKEGLAETYAYPGVLPV